MPVVLPPCGHVDRATQLTEIEIPNARGNIVVFVACSAPGCPEYCRPYVDLRDPDLDDEPEPVGAAR